MTNDHGQNDGWVIVSPEGAAIEVTVQDMTPHEHRVLMRPAPRLREACLRRWHWYAGLTVGHVLVCLFRGSETLHGVLLLTLWLAVVTTFAAVEWYRRRARWGRERLAAQVSMTRRRALRETTDGK